MKIRPWCCSMDISVVIIGGGLIAVYLVLGVVAVGRFTLQHLVILHEGSVVEVDSLDKDLDKLVSIENTVPFFAITIGISLVGFMSSLILLVGVMIKSSLYLVPWLVWHVVIILSCIGSGLYLVIHFLLIVRQRDIVKAVVSMGPILAGGLLIFLWVLVDQFYIKLKEMKRIKKAKDPLKMSISSLNIAENQRTPGLKSDWSSRSLETKRDQNASNSANRQLRSLEHLLHSSSDSSTSRYQSGTISCKLSRMTTLPRLRRCPDNPDIFRAYRDCNI